MLTSTNRFHCDIGCFHLKKLTAEWSIQNSNLYRIDWNETDTKGKTVWCWHRTVYYTFENLFGKYAFYLESKWKFLKTSKLIYTSEHLWTINNSLQNRSCSFLKTSRLGLTLQFMNLNVKNSSMFTIICDYMMGWILWRTYIRIVGSFENMWGQVVKVS